ncbi:MAG: type IV secretory system conjugative DNA transfer family protein [Pseudomonadaceae bacterium]|nr:type IV secretory system conjugative DNA transfer family protein [Pseudomonadaceae bacterium]
MNIQRRRHTHEFCSALVFAVLAGWIATQLGPLFVYGQVQTWPAIVYGFAAICALSAIQNGFEIIAHGVDWFGARSATGKSGTARWAKFKDLKGEMLRKGSGPFWGLIAKTRKALFIDFSSNAMCVGPAGSGKGINSVVPSAMGIKSSKVIADFKGELVCMLKKPLEKRGETVRVLNPGGLWKDTIGQSDALNPLDIIVDDLKRAEGLRDVFDDLREQTAQILPEPSEQDGENTYFREGSRRLIADAMLMEAMVEEYDATLSSAALLIEDRDALERNARWIIGVDLEGKPLPAGPMPIEQTLWAVNHSEHDVEEFSKLVRARARNLLALMTGEDNRTFESFISGAQQALAPFAFGRLAPAMGRSTFSPDELKDGITALFIVADASRMEAYKPFLGLAQWCVLTMLKRHKKKEASVYFLLDESTNYKIHGLAPSLLTWGRSYGIRLLLWLQDLQAFETIYGKTALDTLLSETEIKLFLPGQRNPKTLDLLQKMLGDQSVMASSVSQKDELGLNENFSESSRPLMYANEIRQSHKGLLFVRRAPPILVEPVSYAEIHPWRKQVGINPFHGKPFIKKTKMRV